MSIDDSLLRQKLRPRSSILDEIDAAPETTVSTPPAPGDVPDLEELTPLPRAGDPYKAFSRPDRKALATLRLLAGTPRSRGLCYADLHNIDMIEGEDGSAVIVLGFSGLVPVRVQIEGRNLEKLHDLLAYHRVSWVRALPSRRDFRGEDETVIVRITVEAVERER